MVGEGRKSGQKRSPDLFLFGRIDGRYFEMFFRSAAAAAIKMRRLIHLLILGRKIPGPICERSDFERCCQGSQINQKYNLRTIHFVRSVKVLVWTPSENLKLMKNGYHFISPSSAVAY